MCHFFAWNSAKIRATALKEEDLLNKITEKKHWPTSYFLLNNVVMHNIWGFLFKKKLPGIL